MIERSVPRLPNLKWLALDRYIWVKLNRLSRMYIHGHLYSPIHMYAHLTIAVKEEILNLEEGKMAGR